MNPDSIRIAIFCVHSADAINPDYLHYSLSNCERSELSIVCSMRGFSIYIYICSALFRNLRFLQKALRFLGIPRKCAIL